MKPMSRYSISILFLLLTVSSLFAQTDDEQPTATTKTDSIGFQEKYGNTYADYITNSVELSDILHDLVHSSESYTDALHIINYFDVKFTHNYLEVFNANESVDKDDNLTLSVSN